MILKAALLTTVAWVRERALFRARASGARDEADRRRTEERFRLAVESSPSGMVMVDAGGTIMLVNAETERLFGYKRDELMGRSMDLLVPERFRGAHPRHRAGFMARPEARRMGAGRDLYGLRKDGSEFPVEIGLNPIQTPAGMLVLSAIVDITGRKAAEEMERRSRELEVEKQSALQASRLKSEFLANMSHELRTPLNAINGFAQLMLTGRSGAIDESQRECLDHILTSGRHLLTLINDVLDLSKVEAGFMEFWPEPVDLSALIDETADIVREMAARKWIRLERDVDTRIARVTADPGRLKQVLYNYVSNAIKFTPRNGCVWIRAKPESEGEWRLEVEDTGIGIRAEDLGRLWVEFQQLEAGAAKSHSGTGLGLALVKKIVAAQGGRVGVSSAPGKGSVFFAVLPRLAVAFPAMGTRPADAPPASAPAPISDHPRILVIDDEPKDLAWIAGTLASAGYTVETAATGAAALALAAEREYDAITLDLELPDMTGLEVARRIRVETRNALVPIVVVSVSSGGGIASVVPISAVLRKPVTSGELLAALEHARVRSEDGPEVLVVEDDPASLRLMQVMLADLGFPCVGCARGEEGLSAARRSTPGAVILDLMLPGMDGFGFLEEFRKLPRCRHVPVIVWTVRDLTIPERDRLASQTQAFLAKAPGAEAVLVEDLRRCLQAVGKRVKPADGPREESSLG